MRKGHDDESFKLDSYRCVSRGRGLSFWRPDLPREAQVNSATWWMYGTMITALAVCAFGPGAVRWAWRKLNGYVDGQPKRTKHMMGEGNL